MSNINNKQPLLLRSLTTGNLSNSAEASTTTQIFDPKGFLLGCAKKGGDRNNQPAPTICESSFNPQLVSIGPLHKEDPKLKEFEWMKECYLDDLLSRFNNCNISTPQQTLEACLLKVNTLIPQIRESYAGMKKKYSDDEVATMMVMDGCFILEFCFKHKHQHSDLPNKMQNSHIAMDLILLENQIPFFVLQALFDCTLRKAFSSLPSLLEQYLAHYINLFNTQLPKFSTRIHFDTDLTHDHLLGYLHKRYQLVGAKSLKPHAGESKLVAAKSSNPIHALKSKLVAVKSLNPIRALISKLVVKKGS
ncbi:putative UPF0481 protein [Tanacetum coccineum]